ncbi:MAG: peroxiredoxin-like family protein [Acidiferrobacteraceae bacterium]|jgi:peroxiredoxin
MARRHSGEILEQYELESIQGSSVPVPHPTQLTHLQFRRFAGCPMCNLHIHSFMQGYDQLLAAGIQEVAIFHSDKDALLKHHTDAPFPIVADPKKLLYKAFGVEASILSVLNPGVWPAAFKGMFRYGVGLPALGESPLGLPADFLIDSNGRILAAKYGDHAYDHWEVAHVLELARKARQA